MFPLCKVLCSVQGASTDVYIAFTSNCSFISDTLRVVRFNTKNFLKMLSFLT